MKPGRMRHDKSTKTDDISSGRVKLINSLRSADRGIILKYINYLSASEGL